MPSLTNSLICVVDYICLSLYFILMQLDSFSSLPLSHDRAILMESMRNGIDYTLHLPNTIIINDKFIRSYFIDSISFSRRRQNCQFTLSFTVFKLILDWWRWITWQSLTATGLHGPVAIGCRAHAACTWLPPCLL